MRGRAVTYVMALGASTVAVTAIPSLPTAHAQPALSCAGISEQERFDRSDVVFSGRVVSVRVKRVSRYSPDGVGVNESRTATYRIKPDRVYKGYVRSPQRVRFVGAGASRELVPGGRERFLFFASLPSPAQQAAFRRQETRPPVFTGPCGGTRRLERGAPPPFVRDGQE